MKTVRLVMAIHDHQPVGNFDEVFRKGCRMAYQPFLDLLDEFPNIRSGLHFSGPLLEWMEQNERGLLDRVAEGVAAGRFEIMGGGFGEPILTMLPEEDIAGQIALFRGRVRNRFGVAPRGIWLTERVWEPALASMIHDAGVEYTIVDDFHFKCAGLRDADLTGYFIVEDRGRMLKVFSGSEFLRYAIPFMDPEATIEHLRKFATEDGSNVIVYADDGEKFGLWPETYKHVYENGWLRRFFQLLDQNRDWIKFTTCAEVLDSLPPAGKAFPPEASYREMTEWALPTHAQTEMEEALTALKHANLFDRARPFMRGGNWRNFKIKYAELAQMYGRMMEVSRLVSDRRAAKAYEEARRELYRGQCNCAYWHGVFGGVYMPFLRFAIYQKLLAAENLLSSIREHPARTVRDFDYDGRPEVKLRNSDLCCYLKPDRGGAIYELDSRKKEYCLTSVMTRRVEASHRRLIEAAGNGTLSIAGAPSEKPVSIHDRVRAKEPGLEKRLIYDDRVRESLVDRFFAPGATPEQFRLSQVPELGDFATAEYDLTQPRSKACSVTLQRNGAVGHGSQKQPISLAKRVSLEDNAVEIRYVLGFPSGAPDGVAFGVEFNFGLMAGQAMDRNFFSAKRENLGNLSQMLDRRGEHALGLVDEHLGVEIWLRAEPAADWITYPVETVNDSEEGFERVYQGSAVIPCWRLHAQPGEEQIVQVTLEVVQR